MPSKVLEKRGCRITLIVASLPFWFFWLFPSMVTVSLFLGQAVSFKSQAAKIVQVKEAFERAGAKVRIGAGTRNAWNLDVYSPTSAGFYPSAYLSIFSGSEREERLKEAREIAYIALKQTQSGKIEETMVRGDDWIVFAYTFIDPSNRNRAAPEEAIFVRSVLEKTRFKKYPWYPWQETKALFSLNRGSYNLFCWSNPLTLMFWLVATPGKWFCYVLAIIIGFTPYYLLFIWPLALLAGAAIYIKHRLKQQYSTNNQQPTTNNQQPTTIKLEGHHETFFAWQKGTFIFLRASFFLLTLLIARLCSIQNR